MTPRAAVVLLGCSARRRRGGCGGAPAADPARVLGRLRAGVRQRFLPRRGAGPAGGPAGAGAGRPVRPADESVVDGAVEGTGAAPSRLGGLLAAAHRAVLPRAATAVLAGALLLGVVAAIYGVCDHDRRAAGRDARPAGARRRIVVALLPGRPTGPPGWSATASRRYVVLDRPGRPAAHAGWSAYAGPAGRSGRGPSSTCPGCRPSTCASTSASTASRTRWSC